METYYYQPKKITFSKIELKEIGISVAVLTIALTLVLTPFRIDYLFLKVLIISFVAVATGFLFHELAHKIVAQKYGCWAEFRYWFPGLLFALISSFFGFIFAAPGAVYISGSISREQNGKISAAGPFINMIIGTICILVLLLVDLSIIRTIALLVGIFNIFLAGFNMIPFPPFDGSKVIRWNVGIYIAMLTFIVLLYLLISSL